MELSCFFTGIMKAKYPLQVVTGCPGSGNDWVLWLGAVFGK